MDLCCLPISTGSSLSFLRHLFGLNLNAYSLTSTQHLNTWDAMQIHRIMKSRASVAIHHSTLSPEDEARGSVWDFVRTSEREQVSRQWGDDGCFVVANVGEVLYLDE